VEGNQIGQNRKTWLSSNPAHCMITSTHSNEKLISAIPDTILGQHEVANSPDPIATPELIKPIKRIKIKFKTLPKPNPSEEFYTIAKSLRDKDIISIHTMKQLRRLVGKQDTDVLFAYNTKGIDWTIGALEEFLNILTERASVLKEINLSSEDMDPNSLLESIYVGMLAVDLKLSLMSMQLAKEKHIQVGSMKTTCSEKDILFVLDILKFQLNCSRPYNEEEDSTLQLTNSKISVLVCNTVFTDV
jgi:hypothetical protein